MAFEGRRENLARQLKGDLDMIVLMAMRKEPEHRYSSVEQFSADLVAERRFAHHDSR